MHFHIGQKVRLKGSKNIMGVVTDRPPISNCWRVLWLQGNGQSKSSIKMESQLEIAEVKS
jgi:hypothetical protein